MLITRKRRIDAGIDMTPLIDVVFQLLIFLMVSSQFIKPEQRIELPNTTINSEEVSSENQTLTLVIDSNNTISLEGKEIAIEELDVSIRDAIKFTDITALEIRGDKTSNLETFLKVIEICRANGITSLGVHKKNNEAN